uniref:Uncharacterized protein n=1 Tax=Setaria viridis TaxID=4556 RepID=A0A4U6THQ5_SETVI|nr:hypothetical protein SEVIR_8G086000v2 [Setaria viridis]
MAIGEGWLPLGPVEGLVVGHCSRHPGSAEAEPCDKGSGEAGTYNEGSGASDPSCPEVGRGRTLSAGMRSGLGGSGVSDPVTRGSGQVDGDRSSGCMINWVRQDGTSTQSLTVTRWISPNLLNNKEHHEKNRRRWPVGQRRYRSTASAGEAERAGRDVGLAACEGTALRGVGLRAHVRAGGVACRGAREGCYARWARARGAGAARAWHRSGAGARGGTRQELGGRRQEMACTAVARAGRGTSGEARQGGSVAGRRRQALAQEKEEKEEKEREGREEKGREKGEGKEKKKRETAAIAGTFAGTRGGLPSGTRHDSWRGRSECRASQPLATRVPPSACHGSAPPTLFHPSAEKANTPPTSHASARSPNPHGSLPPRPPDRPEAPDACRPRPITAEDHLELRLLCPMASSANGRLARALAAPGLILSPPEPRLDPPRHPGPIKGNPLTSNAIPCHRPHLRRRFLLYAPTFSSEPPPSPRAAAELPWSSPLCATPTLQRFCRHPLGKVPLSAPAASSNPPAARSSARYSSLLVSARSTAAAGPPSKSRRCPSLSAYDFPSQPTPVRPQGFTGRPGELNLADGTYELHPAPEEDPVEELHPFEGEPEPEQDPEDPQAFLEDWDYLITILH